MSSPPAYSTGTQAMDALYRKFFNDFQDEVYLHDAAGRIIDLNDAACLNLGYMRQELIGQTVGLISATFDEAQLAHLWRNHPVGPHTVNSNCHRRKDGSTYHLEVHLSCQEVSGSRFFLAVARSTDEKRQRQHEIEQLNARMAALLEERTQQWRQSTQLLNAVMEQTPDAIFIKDLQGRYVYANDALAKQLKLSTDEVLGKTDQDLYPQEQAALFVQTDREVLQHNAPRVYEDRMQTGSGLVFANSMKTPHRDENGHVVGILGITRNVSDIRNAQEQMAHNYAMLRQAERVAKIGSWTLDLSTHTFSASEMLIEMNGLTRQDPPLTPDGLSAMIPSEQHTVLSAAIDQCIREGTPYTVDVSHKRPGGGTFPARIRGQAFRDAAGRIIMLHGTLQDLSDYVEADQRLQTLADNLPNGAIFRCEQTVDGKLFLRYVSAGIQRLLGITANTFLAQQTTFTSHIFEDDKAHFFAAVQNSLKTQTAFDLVSRIRNHEGQLRWMRARAAPRSMHQGVLWEGILLDVTAEYEVQESLRQAKEAAESAERAKSEFLATMSHEIRTPMNTVIGMTQLLLQTPMTAKQRNYLDKVALSTHTLLQLINEILDFSKLEAEMLHIDPQPFALDELLESVSTVTALQAEQKGVEMAYNIAPSVPRHLMGDMQRLSQVLTNLVGNAIKFTDRGEVVVSMHAMPEPSDAQLHTLYVTVRDTGIGIHPEHMSLLFQPFTQAEAHISRRFGGTGLGLAISQKLVHLMGGDIQVQSRLGEGSSFSFYVRLQAQASAVAQKNFNGSPCRVLVVDDNLMARDILSNMVRSFGLNCEVACDGQQALDVLRAASCQQQPFQLVLMDWQMPGMDGLQAVECIRNDTALSQTPAMLMVTAYGRDAVLERIQQLALQGLLIKPVTESVLFNAMQEALLLPQADHGAPVRSLLHQSHLKIPTALQGRRVLVVDDNGLNREVAQDFLELAGITVTTAQSGSEALELLHAQAFDAVLLDVQMPDMDGLEVAQRIRQDAALKHLPVWALTAQTRAQDHQAILQSGMDGQLTKPINAQLLFQTLEQALSPLPPAGVDTLQPSLQHPAATGLARHFQGHAERMKRLLRAFVRDFSESPVQLQTLYQQKEWKALGMLAHTLKGSLGYLDQIEAAQAMDDLESACQRAPAPNAVVSSAAQHLQTVLEHVDHILTTTPSTPKAPSPTLLDQFALLDLIEQALPAIRRGDYAGIRHLESVETALRGSSLHGLAARALALTEDLETEAACQCLQQLQQALHSNPPGSATSDLQHHR